MGKGHFAEMPHLRTFAERPHRTGEISQTVGRKYRSAFERRNVKSTGQMRGVMLDPMEFCANGIGCNFKARSQVFLNPSETFHHPRAIQREFGHAHRETQFGSPPRPRGVWNRDVTTFGKFTAP